MEPGTRLDHLRHVSLVRADWLSVEESLERVLARAEPLGPTLVPLGRALGRVLAGPLVARATLPGFPNSAMDGYAVRAADLRGASSSAPVRLRVTGRTAAGAGVNLEPVQSGEAVRIMTGAPLPPGADSVVRVEDTEGGWKAAGEDVVAVDDRDVGRHVRPRGEDVRAGETLVQPGALVTPGLVGAAAALGHEELPVASRPKVAIMATGDELRSTDAYGEVIRGVAVPESNSSMLAAQATACGARIVSSRLVGDERTLLRDAVTEALAADVLVVSGGASMGDRDLVKEVLLELGFEPEFWRVRMRPGSPVAFGVLGELPVFSLPGNPSSAFVTFEVLARPLIGARAGLPPDPLRTILSVAGEELAGPARTTSFLRVKLDHGGTPPVATLSGPQGSGLVRALALAEGLARIPEGVSRIRAGEAVEVTRVG